MNKKLNKELNKESNKKLNKELNKESNKESNKELIEIINPKKDEDTTDWYDKNKFKKILTTIDSNNFNHKNKIGKLKFNDINNLINNIKNNTISETDAKQKLNELDEIKKVETKNKRLISSQKILLNLFVDLLKTIFNNNNNNECVNDNESANDNESVNGYDDDKEEEYYKIKQINNGFKTIDKIKSFEVQIEILKTKDFLDECWYDEYYHDNKKLNNKIFKVKVAHLLNDVDEKLFKKIFDHTFVKLADKLLNTTSKEENKIIIDDIKNNRDKIFEQDDFNQFVIKQGYKRGDLNDAVKMLLKFNETIQLDLT